MYTREAVLKTALETGESGEIGELCFHDGNYVSPMWKQNSLVLHIKEKGGK